METNENHALTKAESCYHCKPLVQQRDELAEKVAMLEHKLANVGSQLTLTMAEVSSLRSSSECVFQERNELAAQVVRLRSVVEEYHSENIACEEAMNELVFMLKQPESAALAALKEQWQADAVRDFEAMLSSFPVTAEDWIEQRAQEAGDDKP